MKKPTHKIYRTTNWLAYNRALINRGNIAIWFDPATQWYAPLNGGWGDVSASVVLFRGIGFGKTGLGEASSDGLISTYDRGVAASAGVSSGYVIPSLSSYKVEACFTNDPRGPICNGRNGRCEKSVPKPKPRSYIDPKTIPEYDPRSHAHIPPNNVNINDIFNKMSF